MVLEDPLLHPHPQPQNSLVRISLCNDPASSCPLNLGGYFSPPKFGGRPSNKDCKTRDFGHSTPLKFGGESQYLSPQSNLKHGWFAESSRTTSEPLPVRMNFLPLALVSKGKRQERSYKPEGSDVVRELSDRIVGRGTVEFEIIT